MVLLTFWILYLLNHGMVYYHPGQAAAEIYEFVHDLAIALGSAVGAISGLLTKDIIPVARMSFCM